MIRTPPPSPTFLLIYFSTLFALFNNNNNNKRVKLYKKVQRSDDGIRLLFPSSIRFVQMKVARRERERAHYYYYDYYYHCEMRVGGGWRPLPSFTFPPLRYIPRGDNCWSYLSIAALLTVHAPSPLSHLSSRLDPP